VSASPETAGIVGAFRRAGRGIEEYGLPAFAREAVLRALRPALAPAAAARLRRRAARARSLDDLLEIAFTFDAFGITIGPGQVEAEIRWLLETLEREPPSRVLEIGTSYGGTLFLLSRIASPEATVVSVDLPGGEFGGGYPRWRIPLYGAFARRGQRLELIRGDSHDPATPARVEEILRGEPLDFLFIDGDHTYEGVKADFELYAPLVRPGGLIALHDIAAPADGAAHAEGPTLLGGDVPRFWSELRDRYATDEMVADPAGGFFGIGLVRVE
jgi:predicted O-methyltransferase YrrM